MAGLLIVSDSPAIQSGLGRVTRELAERFVNEGLDVSVAGWFDIHASLDATYDYPVYPATKQAPELLAPLLEKLEPGVVLAIGDPWDFAWLSAQRAAGAPWRLVGYLNVEGQPLPLACERILDGFDAIVTTSQFGAETIGRPGVRAVHHGVDSAIFRRLGAKTGEFVGRKLAETFMVLLNGQNTARKNFPAAIAGFAQFARDKPDVLLYANTNAAPGADGMPGPDLRQTVVALGLSDNDTVWFNPDNHGPLDTVLDERLNRIYNMATVLLVTSWAEGFCLPVLEAQATGVVPVAPEAYSMPELLGSRGFLYPVAARLENEHGMAVAVVSAEAVAEALERAYFEWKQHPDRWEQRRVSGIGFARSKPWDATYRGLKEALHAWGPSRVASGRPINVQLRRLGRAVAARHPAAFGVLKLGGLGDLLQATVVIAAAAEKTGRQAVVFTNQPAPVFEDMKEVVEVVQIAPQPQQVALESLGDAFEVFYDLRYVSRAYGAEQTSEYGDQHRWFYDHWTASIPRLHTLGMHSTRIMLESLGLDSRSIRPIYHPRQKCVVPEGPFLAVASGVGVMGGLKRWPIEAWTKFAAEVGIPIVQVGGSQDELVPRTAADHRGASLPETAWILEQARGLVAVEGGMVHLAAATNTRAVVIFGPTPTETFLYPGHRAAVTPRCTPCWGAEPNWAQETCALGHSTCTNFPTPELVLERARGLLHGGD